MIVVGGVTYTEGKHGAQVWPIEQSLSLPGVDLEHAKEERRQTSLVTAHCRPHSLLAFNELTGTLHNPEAIGVGRRLSELGTLTFFVLSTSNNYFNLLTILLSLAELNNFIFTMQSS